MGLRPRTTQSPPKKGRWHYLPHRCAIRKRVRERAYPGVAQYSRGAGGATRGRLRRREKQPDHLCQSSVVARSYGRLLVPPNGLSGCESFTRGSRGLAGEWRISRIRRIAKRTAWIRDGEEASPYACTWRSKLVVAKLNGQRFACEQKHRFRNGTSARQQMDFSGLVGAQAANGTYRNDPTHRACMSRWPKFNLRGANARGNGLQRNFRFGWWCSHVGTRRLSDRERPRLLPGGTERCRTIAFGARSAGSDEALPGMGSQAHAVSCSRFNVQKFNVF